MDDDKYSWKPALAFLIIALAAGFAIQRSATADAELLHTGLIAACERQNDAIVRENVRTEIMREVLLAAADAREDEALAATSSEVRVIRNRIATRYRELADTLPYAEAANCEEEVPNP